MADTNTATESNEAYAIVEASGTQVWVQPNRYYDLDRLQALHEALILVVEPRRVRGLEA